MTIAKENNFKVSGTGGAGTNGQGAGQPAQYMSSDFERTGDAGNMELQTSATMSKSGPVNKPVNIAASFSNAFGPDVVPLNAPTQRPDEKVTTGAALDSTTAGPEIMSSPSMLMAQNSQDMAKLAAYLPIYARIAESPQATNATRNFYRALRSMM